MSAYNYIITVDWGTSHLRAFLCEVNTDKTLTLKDDANGLGVNKVVNSFEQTLFDCIDHWVVQHGKLPIYMMGQIGSSIGWKETEYLPCPTKLGNLSSKCTNFVCSGHKITILPGLSCRLKNDNYDVMRGEELQVLGWLQLNLQHFSGTHLLCLPGTHTKWVFIKAGAIELFKTAMTGELFDLLTNHSILIKKNHATFDSASFKKGADFTLKSELGSFTHGLFSVRSKQLFGELTDSQASSYLSGLLIGSDVRAAMNAEEWQLSELGEITIIGTTHLSQQFSQVLNMHGIKTNICKMTEMTLLGFNAVYQKIMALSSTKI
ncbi:2-dehydro-3-deoxygalactonokinase [Colwellia sp. C1TZA3]|uniref:2-dehydro-3-deoxygalactonokinase n=1 Tax=Colwellia sp. C1TZA3 TaxID=2508879 RepID=UPI0011B9BF81|nr:2-dehydro-3-deoxygalactonokinase [Colwellia sp. C1TZA3]TWX72458.1 2-dehydro-3-deoxygalactonokinase [Colwellia sp. C1TZA3]